MYYYQVEKYQQTTSICHFGRHYLTRLQMDVIVKSYKQRIREQKHAVSYGYHKSTEQIESCAWSQFSADFLSGDNLNNSTWGAKELSALQTQVKREIFLKTPKPYEKKSKL